MVKKVTKFKVVSYFLNDYGRRYYIRELASVIKKPHQTIKPYIEALVKEGILTKNIRKKITEYSLNFKNKEIFDYLTIAEKERTMQRLKEDVLLKILFEKLSPFFEKNTFIVFGSAVNEIRKGADIDLLMIGKQNMANDLEGFEKVYNKKIHKIQITGIEKLTLTLIKEIYGKHLIFNNTEQVIRFFGDLHERNKLV